MCRGQNGAFQNLFSEFTVFFRDRMQISTMLPGLVLLGLGVTFKLCMTVQKCLHSHARTTCPSCVRRSPKSPKDSTFVRPAAAYSSYREYSSIRTAVVRSPRLVRPSGTHWATTCVIQNSASPASVAYWRRTCFSSMLCIGRIRSTVR